jgi:hypothetical protein
MASGTDATALRRGDSRLSLRKVLERLRMPRPCAVEAHVCRYKECWNGLKDATAVYRGGSRFLLKLKR